MFSYAGSGEPAVVSQTPQTFFGELALKTYV